MINSFFSMRLRVGHSRWPSHAGTLLVGLGRAEPESVKQGPLTGCPSGLCRRLGLVPEPHGGRRPAKLREGGGDFVEARCAGGLDEHYVAGGEVAAEPVDGRVVAEQCHRLLSRAVGDGPGGRADRDHHVGAGDGGLGMRYFSALLLLIAGGRAGTCAGVR